MNIDERQMVERSSPTVVTTADPLSKLRARLTKDEAEVGKDEEKQTFSPI